MKSRSLLCALFLLLATIAGAREPEDDPLHRQLEAARAASEAGRFDEAEHLYREMLGQAPQRLELFRELAEVFVARGRPDAAAALLLRVTRELAKAERFAEASSFIERAAELSPESGSTQALLGRVLGENRRFRAAVPVLERAFELGERGLQSFLFLASAYWESERYVEAEQTYRRALESHGEVHSVLSQLGQFLLWQGRAGEALAILERAARLRPGDADTLSFLARARAESGDEEGAMALYQRVLELVPDHYQARYGLDLLSRRSADHEVTKAVPPTSTAGDFDLVPVAESAGLDFRHEAGISPERHLPESMGAGLAWLDFDGDGLQDLYLVQSGSYPPSRRAVPGSLYRNLGDGTFADVSAKALPATAAAYGQGVVAADGDGDGDIDLYLTNLGPDAWLENRGDGTFVDATQRVGFAGDPAWSSSAAFADADGDGDLDLYVARYVDYPSDHGHFCGDAVTGERDYCNIELFDGVADRFFLREASGWRDATLSAGLDVETAAGRGLGVVFTDLDGDGRPDLYVANDLDPNGVFRNLGLDAEGRLAFEDLSLFSGAGLDREGKGEAGMGVAVGDVDSDGDADLAVTNFDVETNTLYRNLGDFQFADVAAASGFGLPSFNRLGFGIVLLDLDGDGHLDFYVGNGHVFVRPRREGVSQAQPDLILLGDGFGGFRELPEGEGDPGISRGVAVADYDDDGDLDVAVQHNDGPVELWRNDRRAPGPWLGVALSGREGNTQALGARVVLTSGGRRQVRWVTAGGSYQSSSEPRVLFAWRGDRSPATLEVEWPSGRETRIVSPPTGRYLRIVE